MSFSVILKQRLLRFFLRLYTSKQVKKAPKKNDSWHDYSGTTIIISTFEKRFFEFTIPLLKSIRLATNNPVTLVINGNFNSARDDLNYRKFILATQEHPNVHLVTFNSFRGWSSMLNSGILHSDTDASIVLNDDIYLNPKAFKSELEIIHHKVKEKGLVLLNNSWSHFAISRECLSNVGFFDEHFLGIGQEDGDYALRYKSHYGIEVPSLDVSGLVNFVDASRDQSVAVTNGKYSLFNSVYLKIKLAAEGGFAESGWQSGSEGSLRSIYSWRASVYETLGWNDEIAIKLRIEETEHPRYKSK